MIACYLTHPQVAIDPSVPVPNWSLSGQGRDRIIAVLDRPWLRAFHRIVSSQERKAVETASLFGAAIGIQPEVWPGLHENDRSATGFLPPGKFEQAADAFFARPDISWNGWETANDAQSRIVEATERALNGRPADSSALIVGHGAVGTLLKCHFAGRPISRAEDQPAGGGNIHAIDIVRRRLLLDWTPIEIFEGVSYD